MKIEPHICIVCGLHLPPMTRADALAKGAAAVVRVDDGPERTFYRCIGRHSAQEFLQAINLIPQFTRAGRELGQCGYRGPDNGCSSAIPCGYRKTNQSLPVGYECGREEAALSAAEHYQRELNAQSREEAGALK